MRLCSAAVPPAFGVRPERSHWQSSLFGCAAVLGYRKCDLRLMRARGARDLTSRARKEDEVGRRTVEQGGKEERGIIGG
eukprot:2066861-Pyramimonas_sp.AAC.1